MIVCGLVVVGCGVGVLLALRSVRRKRVPSVFVPLLEFKDKDIWPPLTFLVPCIACGEIIHWTEERPIPGPQFHLHRCDPKKLAGRMKMVWSGGTENRRHV